MPEFVDIPYSIAFDAQSLVASGGKASPKAVVPQHIESFVVQALAAVGTQDEGDNARHFLIQLETSKTGVWANQGALADLIAGDGRNPGYFLTEAELAGGDVITCNITNANGAIAYTNVQIVLIGRARKKA